jgi:hypothetical protein
MRNATPLRHAIASRVTLLPQNTDGVPLEECRIKSLGGRLPDHLADDFFNEAIGAQAEAARARARAVCRRCPLQRPCLLSAIEAKEPMGIRGGLTAQERQSGEHVRWEMEMISQEAS